MHNIIPPLLPLAVSVDSLAPDPKNARKHNARNLKAIEYSLATYGQRKPVVVNRRTGQLEAGHGTLEAARALGWDQIAAVMVDDDAKTAVGYGIADNRSAELGQWDFEVLGDLMRGEVADIIPDLGWLDYEASPILAAEWRPEELTPLVPEPADTVTISFLLSKADAVLVTSKLDSTGESDKAKALLRLLESNEPSVGLSP